MSLPVPRLTATIVDGRVVVHEGFGWRHRLSLAAPHARKSDGARSHCSHCRAPTHNARTCPERFR